ncbi:MAG: PKD domain-containing protein [Flavobacteriales bacterium]|nr:PKD domain-containing protein [Flavobacteriales bacterium]
MRASFWSVPMFLSFLPVVASGQSWSQGMSDPGTNFHAVRDAFNAHWEGRPYERGKGYKVFKRWEWWMEPRTYPSGVRPDPGIYVHALKDLKRMELVQGAKSNADWQPMGPVSWTNWASGYNPGNGRVNCSAVDPGDPQTIYAGTPGGGLWKSTDAGQSWAPLFTDLATLGVSGIAIDPTDPQTIYCATGDGDGTDTYSIGVIKSTDGGGSWNATGLDWQTAAARTTRALRMRPDDPLTLLCATNNGLWKTTDGANTWYQVASGSFHDVEFKPDDPGIVYACGDQFFRSLDGGEQFDLIDTGLPVASDVNRMRIAVTPADPFKVYVLAGREEDAGFLGLYRSNNGGSSFQERSTAPNIFGYEDNGGDDGGQSWYDMALTADPDDADVIWAGGVNVWKSTDGGASWNIRSHWYFTGFDPYTHADIHSLDAVGGRLLCGSDGGLFSSTDGGDTWTDLSNGLQITQLYRLGCSPTDPSRVIAGAQDNGMNLLDGDDWSHVLGADGMEGAIDPEDPQIMYGEQQYGGLYRSDDGGQNFFNIAGQIGEQGAWVTPFAIDPVDPQILVAGYNNIWKSSDRGDNWEPLSAFDTDLTIRALAIAPSNNDVIYCANTASFFRTTVGGSDWDDLSDGLPANVVTAIAVDPTDAAHIFLSVSGYTAGVKVFESTDAGDNWNNISGNLPNVPANTLIYQNGSDDGLYVGTDLGVFYSDNTLGNWQPFNTGLPKTPVMELEIFYPDAKLRAATFGRGLWETDLFVPDNTPPNAAFTFSNASICAGEVISFTDLSLGAAPGWTWSFPGGVPATSTDQNPQVSYTTAGSFTATLTVQNPFGSDDHTASVPVTILPNRVDVEITFDNYPGEVSWTLTDDDGQDVHLSGLYTSLDANSSVQEHVCLPEGCYTFTINDTFGDGLCCGSGPGSYTVTNPEIGLIADGGEYTYSESTEFCVNLPVVVPSTFAEEHIDVRALDGEGTYQLSVGDATGPARLTVFDATGRRVLLRTGIQGPVQETISLAARASGVYTVRVELGDRSMAARLVRP